MDSVEQPSVRCIGVPGALSQKQDWIAIMADDRIAPGDDRWSAERLCGGYQNKT
jgi:hypothetical protein